MSQIICKNLSIGYEKHHIIDENINFSIDKGDYLCIVGENGAGKSTLMKTLLNLIPAISGEIIYGDGLKKNEIGYLPQQTDVQRDFPCSCFEIVLSGFEGQKGIRPFFTKKEKEDALSNMAKMGIIDFKNKCYNELSGGQQQRVLLARALCATKKILLLDEPVAGLDPKVSNDMYNLIDSLNKKDQITIIMITHDVSIALDYANKILHVGHTIFFGTKDEYKTTELGKSYLRK